MQLEARWKSTEAHTRYVGGGTWENVAEDLFRLTGFTNADCQASIKRRTASIEALLNGKR